MKKYLTFCPQCGPDVSVNEDGLCQMCGALAMGSAVDALRAEVARLARVAEKAEKHAGRGIAVEAEVERLALALDDEHGAYGKLREVVRRREKRLRWIANQPCERAGDAIERVCESSGDCITEWCLSCYARAALEEKDPS